MLKFKILTFIFAIKNLLIPSIGEKSQSGFKVAKKGYKIEKVGQIPDSVMESSALEVANNGQSFWTLGDGGCKSQLYEISEKGKVLSIFPLPQLKNYDWENMTKDSEGNIYIGDTGNNFNKRRNLRVYKINVNESNRIDTINFSYVDQKAFPPDKKDMNFDCEAMFWYKDSLYLFSKNRGDGPMKMYRLPDKGGKYVAEISQEIYVNSMITAADINPENNLVALLSYGKIYFLKVEEGKDFRLKPYFTKIFNRGKQSEALVFTNDTDLLISNEQGELFEARKKRNK